MVFIVRHNYNSNISNDTHNLYYKTILTPSIDSKALSIKNRVGTFGLGLFTCYYYGRKPDRVRWTFQSTIIVIKLWFFRAFLKIEANIYTKNNCSVFTSQWMWIWFIIVLNRVILSKFKVTHDSYCYFVVWWIAKAFIYCFLEWQ